MSERLRLIQEDITRLPVDAIVNAAHTALREVVVACFDSRTLAAYRLASAV